MKFSSFSNKITKNVSDADFSLIEKAYKFADRAHKGRTRASGEHFIEHSVDTCKKYYCPRKQKHRLNVEYEKQDREDIVPHMQL